MQRVINKTAIAAVARVAVVAVAKAAAAAVALSLDGNFSDRGFATCYKHNGNSSGSSSSSTLIV